MNIRNTWAGRLLGLAGIVIVASTATAQDAPKFGVSDISCRELLTMGGDEQDATMIFMNGYISGKSGDEMIDPSALMAASDTVLSNCIDAPDMPLISVFESVRGG